MSWKVTTKHAIVDETEAAAVAEIISGGDLSAGNAVVARYESALAAYFGVPYALSCTSGSAALHMALLAVGVSAGDTVAVPATAPVMTALPVLAVGARPVFIDVAHNATFAVDLADLDRKMTARTRAVISVPMWGYPADGTQLVAACRTWEVPLIEDGALAHGTQTDGRLVGTQGTVGAFSTHARKLVATGEGGFCLTSDPDVAERLRRVRSFGPDASGANFGSHFGLNFKMPALSAAVGIAQLARLDQRLAARRAVLTEVTAAAAGSRLSPFPVRPDGLPNGYAALLTAPAEVARAVDSALATAGIVSDTFRYGYSPLYDAPVFGAYSSGPCRNVAAVCRRVLAVPCHEGVTSAHVDRMREILAEADR